MMNRRQFFAGLAGLLAPIAALTRRPAPRIPKLTLEQFREAYIRPAVEYGIEKFERDYCTPLADRPFVIVTETLTRDEFARR